MRKKKQFILMCENPIESFYNEVLTIPYHSPDFRSNIFIERENKSNLYDSEKIQDFNSQIKTIFSKDNGDNDLSEAEEKTNFKTLHEKIKIFLTRRIRKKFNRGRRKFGNNNPIEIKHGKKCSDNIEQKIKRKFIQSIWKYLNILYKKYLIHKKGKTELLKKIKTDFTSSSFQKSLKYFSMTLRQFFSSDLSGKYTKTDKNYNKKNIDKLYNEDKAKDIIELMNKTLEEVFKIYISNRISEFNLIHDSNEIKEKENEGNDYMDRYQRKALKLIDKYKKENKKRKQKRKK